MSEVPENCKFLSSHEWVRLEDDGTATVGISDHAQDQLGDIVFIEVPEIGTELNQGDEAALVESVKAASEIYSPLSGKVIKINNLIEDSPEIINTSPYDEGWFFKIEISDDSETENLLSSDQYAEICED
ncbi:MAG: glycine cleavage system protein GcvH [Gammaproteobacteria bacterium]|nr:MAG: glycine cleavage system protein GcvH [Gammaproteobacteria bacterium]